MVRVRTTARAAPTSTAAAAPGTPAPLPAVYVSLTTIPARVDLIWPVLDRLLHEQTHEATQVIVNLPTTYASPTLGVIKQIPAEWNTERLLVNRRCDDLGPATKLLGCRDLDLPADAVILYVDDDHLYPRDLVAKHAEAHRRRTPPLVMCGRGDLLADDGRVRESVYGVRHLPVHLPCGVFGVSVRGVCLRELDADVRGLPTELRFADDLVFGNAYARAGVPVRLLESTTTEPAPLRHSADAFALCLGGRQECPGETTERYTRAIGRLAAAGKLSLAPWHRLAGDDGAYAVDRPPAEASRPTVVLCIDFTYPHPFPYGVHAIRVLNGAVDRRTGNEEQPVVPEPPAVGITTIRLVHRHAPDALRAIAIDVVRTLAGCARVAVLDGTVRHGRQYVDALLAMAPFAEHVDAVDAVHAGVRPRSDDLDALELLQAAPVGGNYLTTVAKLGRAPRCLVVCRRRRAWPPAQLPRHLPPPDLRPPARDRMRVRLPFAILSRTDGAYPTEITGVACYDHLLRGAFAPTARRPAELGDRPVVHVVDNHHAMMSPRGVPVVIVHHGVAATHAERDPGWPGARMVAMQRRMLETRDPDNTCILSCSRFCTAEFARHYGGAYTRFPSHAVPHTPALAQDRPRSRRPAPDRPVVVGDWRLPHKGLHLLPALRKRLPNYEFRQMHVEPPVPFDPAVFAARKEAYYRDADVALILSKHEGNSFFMLDAMLMDLVLVSTDVGLAPELPADEVTLMDWNRTHDDAYVAAQIEAAWARRLEPGVLSGRCRDRYGRVQWIAKTLNAVLAVSATPRPAQATPPATSSSVGPPPAGLRPRSRGGRIRAARR